jgi:hypothetical protein
MQMNLRSALEAIAGSAKRLRKSATSADWKNLGISKEVVEESDFITKRCNELLDGLPPKPRTKH